jgi:succinate--hydroxymethylglutarate CoA-transferase
VAITDLSTGLYLHGAIMAALIARSRNGRGQKIDVSLLSSQISLLANIGKLIAQSDLWQLHDDGQ